MSCQLTDSRITKDSDTIDFTQPWDFGNVKFVTDDGTTLHANREVLCIQSPVFKKMLTSDFKEKSADIIPLPGKDTNLIMAFFEVIHLGLRDIKDDECIKFYELADEYQVASVMRKSLKTAIGGRKSLNKLILADKFDLKVLKKLCMVYAVKKDVCKLEQEQGYQTLNPATKAEIHQAQARLYKRKLAHHTTLPAYCNCEGCANTVQLTR